jgi:hypothetical protein
MKAGFAKTDITPRVGVELCGFGPFLNRRSIGARDKLWARAMVLDDGNKTLIVVSCDLLGLESDLVDRVRQRVTGATGVAPENILVHCTHTHSGPATCNIYGWGQMDGPYMEILPSRIVEACLAAIKDKTDVQLSHAEVPCEGIGLNREYDRDAPPLDEILKNDWRPAKPEFTDTTCHVIKAVSREGRLIGFASYFGCHPVVCCQETRYIHGDYAGVATNMLEREHPGSVGLFLQGAQGDVNSCCVHKPEPESLLALDVIASRYANSVRKGLFQAAPLDDTSLASARRAFVFSRIMFTREQLTKILEENETIAHAPGASDAAYEVRLAAVYIQSIRQMLVAMDAGKNYTPAIELQGLRIGPLSLLGAPFEIFQAIKNDVVKDARSKVPLVMGLTNGCCGYAPDRTVAARGGYAAQMVPIMIGYLPYVKIHDELVAQLLMLDADLHKR